MPVPVTCVCLQNKWPCHRLGSFSSDIWCTIPQNFKKWVKIILYRVKLLLIMVVIIIQDLNIHLYLSLMCIGLEIILQVCRYWKSHLCIKILTNKNGKRKTNFHSKNLFFHRLNLEKWVITRMKIRIKKKRRRKHF